MTNIAYMLSRILAVFIFIEAIRQLFFFLNASFLPFVDRGIQESLFLIGLLFGGFLPVLFLFIVSVYLWVNASFVAKQITPANVICDEKEIDLSSFTIYQIALSLIGVIVLVGVIPEIFKAIPQIIFFQFKQFSWLPLEQKLSIIFTSCAKIVELLIGLILIFGRKRLSMFLSKLRNTELSYLDESKE